MDGPYPTPMKQWRRQEFVMGDLGSRGKNFFFRNDTFPSEFYPQHFFSSAKISDPFFIKIFSENFFRNFFEIFSENLALFHFFFYKCIYYFTFSPLIIQLFIYFS